VTSQKTLLLIKRKDARRCRLRTPLMQSEAIEGSPPFFGQNQNSLKISDNVTAPLLLGLLLRLSNNSLFSTTTPGQNLSPTDRRHCDLAIILDRIPYIRNCLCFKQSQYYIYILPIIRTTAVVQVLLELIKTPSDGSNKCLLGQNDWRLEPTRETFCDFSCTMYTAVSVFRYKI